mgnify:CR=1 FL=1
MKPVCHLHVYIFFKLCEEIKLITLALKGGKLGLLWNIVLANMELIHIMSMYTHTRNKSVGMKGKTKLKRYEYIK